RPLVTPLGCRLRVSCRPAPTPCPSAPPPSVHSTVIFLFFCCSGDHRDLHSFPTRRSSDLVVEQGVGDTGEVVPGGPFHARGPGQDRKSTRLNSSHVSISYAVFCLKEKKTNRGVISRWVCREQYRTTKHRLIGRHRPRAEQD